MENENDNFVDWWGEDEREDWWGTPVYEDEAVDE